MPPLSQDSLLFSRRYAHDEAEKAGDMPLGRYESGRKFYHVFRSEDGYRAVWGMGTTQMGERSMESARETDQVLRSKVARTYVFREGYFSHPGHRVREEVRAADLQDRLPPPSPRSAPKPRF